MDKLTPNQIIAGNLRLVRRARGMTQEQAAELLEPHLGERWSKATFSIAERCFFTGKRIRQFTADDIAAFAAGFDLPVAFFFKRHDQNDYASVLLIDREQTAAAA